MLTLSASHIKVETLPKDILRHAPPAALECRGVVDPGNCAQAWLSEASILQLLTSATALMLQTKREQWQYLCAHFTAEPFQLLLPNHTCVAKPPAVRLYPGAWKLF